MTIFLRRDQSLSLKKKKNEALVQHTASFSELCDEYRKEIQEIHPEILSDWIESNRSFYLIDVRDADEFEKGAIKNARPLSKGWIEAKIHEVVPHKDATIVLYCGGGYRSILAAYNLKKMGYEDVYSLIGGYKKWVLSQHLT